MSVPRRRRFGVVSGPSSERGAKVLAELGVGELAQFVRADATDDDQAAAAIRACVERYGAVDLLVNNMGGAASGFNLVDQLSDEGWGSGLLLNLYSALWAMREALTTIVAHRWDRTINTSSGEDKLASLPAISPNVTAQHALHGLTKSVAVEYDELGFTCNAISPGAVDSLVRDTEKLAVTTGGSDDDVVEDFVEHSATERRSSVEQVAAVAVLMASGAGANIAVWPGASTEELRPRDACSRSPLRETTMREVSR